MHGGILSSTESVWDWALQSPLTLLGAVREFLGTGKVFNSSRFIPEEYGMLVFVLAPGAFIALGYLIALVNSFKKA